ncbi:MAG: hypothetical protein R3C10_14210 [Pirellulales bacterium]
MDNVVRLRARLVIPVATSTIADGVVTIRNGSIAEVAACSDRDGVLDLGNVAILPGLVNAHTHLEFSDLARPLGHSGAPLVDWIRDVIAQRRSR